MIDHEVRVAAARAHELRGRASARDLPVEPASSAALWSALARVTRLARAIARYTVRRWVPAAAHGGGEAAQLAERGRSGTGLRGVTDSTGR